MLDSIKIMDEINRLLVIKYPDFTVYINEAPKDFKRPSFLIEYVKNIQDDANYNLILEKVYYTVTYFSEVNDYYKTDKMDLQKVLIEMLKIFRIGYTKIENRSINVKASNGGINENEIYMDLQFEYYEDRLEEQENPENTYAKMGEINVELRR